MKAVWWVEWRDLLYLSDLQSSGPVGKLRASGQKYAGSTLPSPFVDECCSGSRRWWWLGSRKWWRRSPWLQWAHPSDVLRWSEFYRVWQWVCSRARSKRRFQCTYNLGGEPGRMLLLSLVKSTGPRWDMSVKINLLNWLSRVLQALQLYKYFVTNLFPCVTLCDEAIQ